MANNILKHLVIDISATLGDKVLLLGIRPYADYKEGVKGDPKGLTFNCLCEKMDYEKVDIKIEGILQPPFAFDNTPIPVEFEGLSGKVWQDWSNKGEVKLSLTAENIRPLAEKQQIKLGGNKA